MSPYPPFPFFTFVGFLVHFLVMFAIVTRLLRKRGSKAVRYLTIGVLAYTIDFAFILTLFFLFPNTIIKTHIFAFVATVLVPVGTLFLVLSVGAVIPKREKIGWAIFIIGVINALYTYSGVLTRLKDIKNIQYSYIHPAYPLIITQSQGIGGFIGTTIICLFFFYHAFRSALFVRRRAIIIGIATFLLAVSSFYWVSTTKEVYLFTHIVGPIGSIILAVGFFAFDTTSKTSIVSENSKNL